MLIMLDGNLSQSYARNQLDDVLASATEDGYPHHFIALLLHAMGIGAWPTEPGNE